MQRTAEDWISAYKLKGALWIHGGNPKQPHARLTSENHSYGFFNSQLVIPDEVLLRDAASDLLELFAQVGGDVSQVQGVVGPQTGATKLAELLSNTVAALTGGDCFSASPAQHESEGVKTMVFCDEERNLLSGQRVLLCDDVLTTCGSVELAATAVAQAGGIVMPFVLALVNRSGQSDVSGRKIVALIDRAMPMWTPEECPLCKLGSEALRPKDNWEALNADY